MTGVQGDFGILVISMAALHRSVYFGKACSASGYLTLHSYWGTVPNSPFSDTLPPALEYFFVVSIFF